MLQILMQFSPTDVVSVATFELLYHTITNLPIAAYDITDLGVLLNMTVSPCYIILYTCGGVISAGLYQNDILNTIDPALLPDYCSILLSINSVLG